MIGAIITDAEEYPEEDGLKTQKTDWIEDQRSNSKNKRQNTLIHGASYLFHRMAYNLTTAARQIQYQYQ